jgi:hypothetical protein
MDRVSLHSKALTDGRGVTCDEDLEFRNVPARHGDVPVVSVTDLVVRPRLWSFSFV